MAMETQRVCVGLLTKCCGDSLATPDWLLRPGRSELGRLWEAMCGIYTDLTALALPETMPPRERRNLDGVFELRGRFFVFELDEAQHFNRYRLVTLNRYPTDVKLGFDLEEWKRRCRSKSRLEGVGFGKPKPPLFPGDGGRHRQRAYRDALADLLPPEYGFLPTLRLAQDEALSWIHESRAVQRMGALLEERYG